jgi:AraC-like DNA-binding protein
MMPARLEIRRYAGGDRHCHDYCQFLIPLQGSMRIDIDGRCDVVASPCLAVIPHENVHDFVPSADCNMLVLDVESEMFATGALPDILKGEGPVVTCLEPWLWRLFRQLGAEVSADARRADDAARVALTGLQLVQFSNASASSPRADRRILDAAHALGKNTEMASMTDMARMARLGQSQFHALFRATTGQSPKQYHLRRKLDRAVERLVGTPDPVSEIAYSLGYENASSFNRLFKRRFGVTPSEFRAAGRH